jgi:hypothetical protein
MKTDGQKCIKEPKVAFFSFLSRTPADSDRVNVYCWCLVLQRERVTVMISVLLCSILSVQIVYSVQLNCTDSNYRETE